MVAVGTVDVAETLPVVARSAHRAPHHAVRIAGAALNAAAATRAISSAAATGVLTTGAMAASGSVEPSVPIHQDASVLGAEFPCECASCSPRFLPGLTVADRTTATLFFRFAVPAEPAFRGLPSPVGWEDRSGWFTVRKRPG
jgi:hypothetical protein